MGRCHTRLAGLAVDKRQVAALGAMAGSLVPVAGAGGTQHVAPVAAADNRHAAAARTAGTAAQARDTHLHQARDTHLRQAAGLGEDLGEDLGEGLVEEVPGESSGFDRLGR